MWFFATVALILAVFVPGFRKAVLICFATATLIIAWAVVTNGIR